MIVPPRFVYSAEKNILLQATRSISFDDIVKAIGEGKQLADIKHPDRKRYPHQRIMVVQINNYVWAVPYISQEKGVVFLKTTYPSRVLTKRYLQTNETKQ